MKIKLQSRDLNNNRYWRNGLHWRLEFSTWHFYECENLTPSKRDGWKRGCEWTGNTRKEYKQHLKEYHGTNI